MRRAASTSDPLRARRRRPLGALVLACMLGACGAPADLRQEQLHVFGSVADITIQGAPPEAAQAALAEASALLSRYHGEWHAWEDSDLVRLNAAFARGEDAAAPASVLELVELSRPLVEESGGLFDPTVGGLVSAWGFHTSTFPVVTPAPRADQLADWRQHRPVFASVQRRGDRLSSRDPRVQLDFGALAEGVAARDVAAVFARHGVRDALISLGGDVLALGDAGGRPWAVSLRDPFGGVLGGVELADGEALFSTGNYNKFRASPSGARWSHILDPRTGHPARGAATVVVLHPDPVRADASATAVFVAGPAGFADLVRRMRLGCVLMVTEENELLVTRAMAARVTLLRQPVPLGDPVDTGASCAG